MSEGQYGVTEKIKTTETTEGKIKECGNWGHPRRDSMGEESMIQEIENRRSIRKYKPDELERNLIEENIYSASLAPSAKNRQPWKFIVYQEEEKNKLVDVMRHGINSEKTTHKLMPQWAFAIPDAENTVRIMQENT